MRGDLVADRYLTFSPSSTLASRETGAEISIWLRPAWSAWRHERGFLRTLPRLTPLAPDIAEAFPGSRLSSEAGLPRLLELFPLDWHERR